MKKKYTGYGWMGWHGDVVINWLCPKCRRGNVRIKKDDYYRTSNWCDGDMTTRDRRGHWWCDDCKLEFLGSSMISFELSRVKKPYTASLETEQRRHRKLYDENEGVIKFYVVKKFFCDILALFKKFSNMAFRRSN